MMMLCPQCHELFDSVATVAAEEFSCPSCGVQVETEYLPPGHPITPDISIDIDRLKQRLSAGEIQVRDGRLVVPGREGGAR